jgi:hypothetical protein
MPGEAFARSSLCRMIVMALTLRGSETRTCSRFVASAIGRPSAAECFVQIDNGNELVTPCLGQSVLGRNTSCCASRTSNSRARAIPVDRKISRILQRFDLALIAVSGNQRLPRQAHPRSHGTQPPSLILRDRSSQNACRW